MDNFVCEINEKVNTNFKITKIPIRTLKEFKSFCKEECGDVYWVGIYQLLKIKKQSEELLSLFHLLQNQINDLKNIQLNKKREEVKTFGKCQN